MDEAGLAAGPGPVSFESFVERSGDRLLELAWLVTRNREDAHDAVQDALSSLFGRWSRLPKGDAFEAYVYRTTVNACLRVIRRRPRTVPVAEPDRLRSAPVSPDHQTGVSVADEVWRLCGDLPPVQRTAVVLRYQRDLDFAEIASILGCRESTARSHVHRATLTLRGRLKEDDR